MSRNAVVVGIDGSADGDLALDWAAEEAARRRRPLRVVHSLPFSRFDVELTSMPAGLYEQQQEAAQGLVRDAVQRVRGDHPQLEVGGGVHVEVGPAEALRREGADAALLVVGSRGGTGFADLLVGSTTTALVRHAPCPVVVVRASDTGSPGRHVVVGVDGSPLSLSAVEFAFAAATVREAGLLAVHAWTLPALGGPESMAYGVPDPEETRQVQEGHAALLSESLAGWREKYPDVPVTESAAEGHPGKVLADASRHAALLVVGSRGRGGCRGLLLGSVSSAVVHHAHCPVAVVRPAAER